MNINYVILFIVIIIILIIIFNKPSENYNPCQKTYIDPRGTEHCYLRCNPEYKPFGNRCSDVFDTFFAS